MTRTDLMIKTKRLLQGDVRGGDLAELFLALRNVPSSGTFVKETGHFLAHSGEREQVPVFDAANNISLLQMRYLIRKLEGRETGGPNFPPEVAVVLRFNAKHLKSRTMAEVTKVPQRENQVAHKVATE
jgi:hypothetical protein